MELAENKRYCVNCGRVVEASWNFCTFCGKPSRLSFSDLNQELLNQPEEIDRLVNDCITLTKLGAEYYDKVKGQNVIGRIFKTIFGSNTRQLAKAGQKQAYAQQLLVEAIQLYVKQGQKSAQLTNKLSEKLLETRTKQSDLAQILLEITAKE
jgi:hypothetical protein